MQRDLHRPNHRSTWSDAGSGESIDYRSRSGPTAGLRRELDEQSNALRSTPARVREYNELNVVLAFEGRQRFQGLAILDSGARDNWIPESLSRRLLLPRQNFCEEVFVGFEGKQTRCSGCVHGFWHYGHQTFSVTLNVCNDLPVDVVFGYDLLRRVGLVNFDDIDRDNPRKVLVLAKAKSNTGQSVPCCYLAPRIKTVADLSIIEEQQQNAAHQEDQRLKAAKAERWHAMNKDKDWTWDPNKRQFWKTNAVTGTTSWSSEKW